MKKANYRNKKYIFAYFMSRNVLNKKKYNLQSSEAVINSQSKKTSSFILLGLLILMVLSTVISMLARW